MIQECDVNWSAGLGGLLGLTGEVGGLTSGLGEGNQSTTGGGGALGGGHQGGTMTLVMNWLLISNIPVQVLSPLSH